MRIRPNLRFENFILDLENQELRRGSHAIPLPPKTFAVLQYLAQNSGRLVTQDELLKAVWGAVAVGEGLLRSYIRDLRKALHDQASHPRFVETVQRRGFRFLPEVTASDLDAASRAASNESVPTTSRVLVGRDQNLLKLGQFLRLAHAGKRQVVLIPGEAGIGKTALVSAFLEQSLLSHSILAVSGQCVEQYGAQDPYLPVFDALEMLCRGPYGNRVVGVLRRHAPLWLSRMPAIIPERELDSLQRNLQGSTQSGMLRELCEALEVIAAERPVIFVLEDLQWSDNSTLDLLSAMARRRESARLMLIGTYRPADVIISAHPLKKIVHELEVHGLCLALRLDYLSEADVSRYLGLRFPGNRFSARFDQIIHSNTAGNPLFLAAVVDDLLHQKLIDQEGGNWRLKVRTEEVGRSRPESIRKLMEAQLDRLSPHEQRVLEASAIVGTEFSADLVAVALESETAEVEERCDDLVRRRQFLNALDSSSRNGDSEARYKFQHDLYRSAAFERVTPARRNLWYRRIAEKLASDAGEHPNEVANELAYYFEQAKQFHQAAHYYLIAAETARGRFANSEAIAQFRRGIQLLEKAPASEERDALELRLQVGLALPLSESQGYDSDEVTAAFFRARDLNQKLGDGPQTFGAMRGIYLLLLGRADYRAALDLCDKLDRVAQREREQAFVVEALRMRGFSAFFLGRLSDSQEAFKRSLSAWKGRDRSSQVSALWDDAEAGSGSALALVLWMLGYPDQALRLGRDALATAKRLAAPYSIAVAHSYLAILMRFLRDVAATLEEAASAIDICDKYGFALWRGQASLEHGWAVAMQGHAAAGIKEIQAVLASRFAAIGIGGSIAKLADACLHAKKTQQGMRAVDEALEFVRDHEERPWEPELYRLRGELLLQRAERSGTPRTDIRDLEQAESCFSTAIECAREIDSKSLELRAAISLHRLLTKRRREKESRSILLEIYKWFTEGLDTPDLVEARGLLRER